MRAPDATAAARSFVAAGRQPQDPANVARRPFVKICGVTDARGRAGGRPRGGRCDRAQPGSGHAPRARGRGGRRAGPGHPGRGADGGAGRGSWPSSPTRRPSSSQALTAAIDPDAIQFSGREPVAAVGGCPARGMEGHPPAGRGARPASRQAVGDGGRGRAGRSWPRAPAGSWSTRPAGRTPVAPASVPPRRSWPRSPARSRSCSPAG